MANDPPPRLLVDEIRQTSFAQVKFKSTSLNLHSHPSRGSGKLILLVHGLGGSGYGTWKELPAMLFNGDSEDGFDVAVFQYRSFYRALPRWGTDPARVADRLAERVAELAKAYEEIYLVGHSLGGLVASAALKKLTNDRSWHDALIPVAAVVLVASPRGGSMWGRILRIARFKEASWLTRSSASVRNVIQFFTSNVQTRTLAFSDASQYLVPVYALIGERDRLVDHFSASLNVPDRQCLRLEVGHKTSAKPTLLDHTQVPWLCGIVRAVSEVRRQWKREHTPAPAPTSAFPLPLRIVTKLLVSPSGLQWLTAYNAVRIAMSNRYVEVCDLPDSSNEPPDVLLTVHDAESAISEAEWDRKTIAQAIAELGASNGALFVGVSAVGERYLMAADSIKSWIPSGSPGYFFVEGARDQVGLHSLMTQYIQARLDRSLPRHTAAFEASRFLDAQTSSVERF